MKNPKPMKRSPAQELALDKAERYSCRCAGLMMAAASVLHPSDASVTWGAEICIDVAQGLLKDAMHAKRMAHVQYEAAQSGSKALRLLKKALTRKAES